MQYPNLSPARKALTAHLEAMQHLRADLQRYDLARHSLQQPLAGLSEDQSDLEAVKRYNRETVQAWLDEALAGAICELNVGELDTSGLAGHEERAREWDRLRSTLQPALNALAEKSTAAARRLMAMETALPDLTAAIMVEEAETLASAFEQHLAAARQTGAQLEALRTRLSEANQLQLAARVARGFVFDLAPERVEIDTAAAAWARHSAALHTNPNATMEL